MSDFERELRDYKFNIEEPERRKQAATRLEESAKLARAEQTARYIEAAKKQRNFEAVNSLNATVTNLLEATGRATFGIKVGNSLKVDYVNDINIAQWTTGIVITIKKPGDREKISTDLTKFCSNSYWSTEECIYDLYLCRDVNQNYYFSARQALFPRGKIGRPINDQQDETVLKPIERTDETMDISEAQLKGLLRYMYLRGPSHHRCSKEAPTSDNGGSYGEKN